jgi:hypothetical protein
VPLLKPPAPTVAKRKYYIRIEEPLAVTMERYADFIGANSADHVITQALQFVFKKDTDFREWLEKNPKRSPEPTMRKANATPRTEAVRVSDTAERQETL